MSAHKRKLFIMLSHLKAKDFWYVTQGQYQSERKIEFKIRIISVTR